MKSEQKGKNTITDNELEENIEFMEEETIVENKADEKKKLSEERRNSCHFFQQKDRKSVV